MFSRTLDQNLSVKLATPYFADELFQLLEQNRTYLRQWLPWVDSSTQVEHTQEFLATQLKGFAEGTGLTELVFWEGRLVGVAGFHEIDKVNQSAAIGYWLSEEHTGRGIMTRVVSDLIDLGKLYYHLQRIEIRCASQNLPSCAIAQRLGFLHEGTLKRSERINEQWVDMEVYALLSTFPPD